MYPIKNKKSEKNSTRDKKKLNDARKFAMTNTTNQQESIQIHTDVQNFCQMIENSLKTVRAKERRELMVAAESHRTSSLLGINEEEDDRTNRKKLQKCISLHWQVIWMWHR